MASFINFVVQYWLYCKIKSWMFIVLVMNFDARKNFDTISVQINFVQFIYVFMFEVNILTLQKLRRSIKVVWLLQRVERTIKCLVFYSCLHSRLFILFSHVYNQCSHKAKVWPTLLFRLRLFHVWIKTYPFMRDLISYKKQCYYFVFWPV